MHIEGLQRCRPFLLAPIKSFRKGQRPACGPCRCPG
jgi:hypothetical protein